MLDGTPEAEVFGDADEPETAAPADSDAAPEKGGAREGSRPMPHPRPGFAGGGAEMRADEPGPAGSSR